MAKFVKSTPCQEACTILSEVVVMLSTAVVTTDVSSVPADSTVEAASPAASDTCAAELSILVTCAMGPDCPENKVEVSMMHIIAQGHLGSFTLLQLPMMLQMELLAPMLGREYPRFWRGGSGTGRGSTCSGDGVSVAATDDSPLGRKKCRAAASLANGTRG